MKKKLLSALLFFSILISGCSFSDLLSTTEDQDNPTSPDKKITTNAEDEQSKPLKPESDDKSDSLTGNNQDSTNIGKKSDDSPDEKKLSPNGKTQPENNPSPSESDNRNGSPTGNNPDPNKTEEKSDDTAGNKAPTEENKEPLESQTPEFTLFDDPLMIGIIVALIVTILILSWLVYDRHKMKAKLNNLNTRPPEPNVKTHNSGNEQITSGNEQITSGDEQLTIRIDNLQQQGKRKEQQDSFCVSDIGDKKAISEKGFMAVVADGMGGLEGGKLISNLVTDTFNDSYKNQFNFEPASFLYHTAENAEIAVENYMKQTGINGGSTLVAVIVKDYQMNYVSVGDSHIYLLQNNILTLINKEHSFGALLKEKADRGEIDPREPYVNPKRNSLTAYIGMGSFKIVDRNEHPIILKAGDKILLCSDGVYNALGDDALIAALAGDASTAAKRIQSDILAQDIPTQDNFTAVIIECVSV